jgi:maleylacetate reductase
MTAFPDHRDADREIVFGPGALERGRDLVGDGFILLSTARARRQAPGLADRAAAQVDIPPGAVDEIAAGLVEDLPPGRIVALGGGRVIDVAKAVAAARAAPRIVIAVPTTLSGAEMTHFHRQARGAPPETPRVRPAVVVNDPALSASAQVPRLAASSANALGHALIAIAGNRSSPIAQAVARDAARRIAAAWAGPEPDRAGLALAALMAGWAVDHSGLGLHHVMTQSAVRTVGVGHADANAALLAETVAAVATRVPEVAALAEVAGQLRDLSAVAGIPALADDPEALARTVRLAAARPELARIPPPPDPAELEAIYRRAARAPG